MPIKGFSEVRRIARVGKIHLGIKVGNGKNQYPKATDYFVVKPDDSTSEAAAKAFHEVYGEKPKEITIAFPSNDPEVFFPQYLCSYRRVGERHELFCQGDGEKANRADGKGGFLSVPCRYKECTFYQEKKCKELGRLRFFLPEVKGVGLWQIDTTSYHSAANIMSHVDMIKLLTGGRIAMIPLKLRIVKQVVNPNGKPQTVYVLSLGLEDMKVGDVINKMSLLPPKPPEIEDVNMNELPEDLYIESNLVDADDQVPSEQPSEPTQDEKSETVWCVASVDVKPCKEWVIAKVNLASNKDELVEAIALDRKLVEKVKQIPEGTVVTFQMEPSKQLTNRMELTDIQPV